MVDTIKIMGELKFIIDAYDSAPDKSDFMKRLKKMFLLGGISEDTLRIMNYLTNESTSISKMTKNSNVSSGGGCSAPSRGYNTSSGGCSAPAPSRNGRC